MEFQRRSSGVAKGGLATGIVGTALGAVNSLALMGSGVNALSRNNDTVDVITPGNPWGWNNGWGWNGFSGNWGGAWGNPWFGQTPQTIVVNSNTEDNNRGRRGRYSDDEGCCSENMLVNRYELGLQQQLAEKDSQIALRDANTYNDQKMLEMYKYMDGRFREFEQAFAAQAVNNQKTADDVLRVQANLDCCCDKMATAINTEARERRCNDNAIVNYSNNTFYAKMIADITTGTTTTRQATYNPLSCECGCGGNQIVVQQVTPATPA